MFRAVMLHQVDGEVVPSIQQLDDDRLPPGDVTVDVEWSTVNYKDGLAYRGAPGVVREYPIVPGVDLAGVVASSDDARWQVGDRVVVNGWRLGERHWGGHAERARVSGDWLTRLPDTVDTRTAMVIGTAGYTAMLCVLALERNDLGPDAGTVVVTGASGGVGSVAVSLLSHLGYRVAAVTGRTTEAEYLRGLGAVEIIDRAELTGPARPLASVRWAGGVDAVGGEILANVVSATAYGGVVAACGLAASMDLPTSVAPFILRAVTLAGVESVEAPAHLREQAWARLATDLDPAQIRAMTTEVALGDLPEVTAAILAGQVRGRVVVDVRR